MRSNLLLATMDRGDLDYLAPHVVALDVGKGDVLSAPGSEVEHLYFPSTACLAHIVGLKNGRSVLASLVGAEGVSTAAPFLAQLPSPQSVQVAAPGRVHRLPAAVMRERIAQSPGLALQLHRVALDHQTQAANNVACASHHKATARLAGIVLTIAERIGSDRLEITQLDLANLLGVQRTSVNAPARLFKASGAINYVRAAILIVDRKALARLACECHSASRFPIFV